ncbi:MAG: APC family permease [Lachnospiraceae bacterium]|nr:APC family permease [Lachnospiraceae bacterium]
MSENVKKGSGFEKSLNPLSVWSLAFGCIIGWGAFMMPGTTFLPSAGTLGTVIAMILGAVIMIIISISYSYMVKKYPQGGGEFTYTRLLLGPKNAFCCAWLLALAFVANVPMNSTALGLMSRKLFFGVFQFGKMYSVAGYDIYLGEVLLGVFALGLLSFLSIIGAQKAGFVDTLMAVALATSFLIIVVSALFSPITSWENLKPFWGTASGAGSKEAVRGIIAVLAVTPWAYVGFGTIPQEVEEFNFSTKKVIRIMVIAILFGCTVYSCNTLVTAAASPDWTAFIAQHDWAVGAAVETLMGKPGLIVLGIAISCAILTGMLGFLTATSRLLFFMAEQGTIPAWFCRLHPKYKTPANSILFCLVFSFVGPWFGRTALGWFVDMSAIGAAAGYGYTNLCAFLTMKKDRELSSRKGFAVLAVLGGLFSVFFLVMLLVPGMPGCLTLPSYIMLAVWLILGVLFYCSRKRIRN